MYAQNDELRTQLKESKRNEKFLQERVEKVEQKLSDLHENLKLLSSEETETHINVMQRKICDLKSAFCNIELIKMHCTEKVCTCIGN